MTRKETEPSSPTRLIFDEEKRRQIAEIWDSLNVGDVVEGTVMRFTDYGAFVDIGGIDGLLHISEISWGKLKHPQEVLQIGQKSQCQDPFHERRKRKDLPWSQADYHRNLGPSSMKTIRLDRL